VGKTDSKKNGKYGFTVSKFNLSYLVFNLSIVHYSRIKIKFVIGKLSLKHYEKKQLIYETGQIIER